MICIYFQKFLSPLLEALLLFPLVLYTACRCCKQSHDKNFFLIKDKVLFQTEKIIRNLTGIPLGTIVFVMRKLYIIEVRGLGLES